MLSRRQFGKDFFFFEDQAIPFPSTDPERESERFLAEKLDIDCRLSFDPSK